MRSARSVQSLPADSHHHTASTPKRVAQGGGIYCVTHSGVDYIAGILSAGRLRTLRVRSLPVGSCCGIPDGILDSLL